ncbi:MAG: hypothetical protein AAF654_05150 [Myxococcota bacterium]
MQTLVERFGPGHRICPKTGYHAWYLRPGGVLGELGFEKNVTADTARFARDILHPEMVARGGDGPYTIAMNWGSMTGYETEARDILVRLGRENKSVYSNTTVCIPNVSILARIGIKSAAAVLTVSGVRINVVESMDELLEAVPLVLDEGLAELTSG